MSIYRVPQTFQDRLEERFGQQFRVRWSAKWDEWQLEQKVRRGLVGTPLDQVDRYHDDVIRYRDGYMWVMSWKQGTKFPCPKCGLTLDAPTRRTEMVSCLMCKLKGYEHRWIASHWPMDDTLIEHIEKMGKELDQVHVKLADVSTALQKQQLRTVLDPTLDGFQDRFEKLAGIQSVGYTGKEFTG